MALPEHPGEPRPNAAARLWRKLLLVVGALGLGLGQAVTPASAQAPQAIPQHWISYAQLVGNQFQNWLADPSSEPVVRLHAWMQERILQQSQPVPPAPLVVRVWVAPSGLVTRLEFDSLGNAQVDADLRTLLTTQPLSEPPPPDMRQPMVLQLTLSFTSAV